jgi:hypothetical protein
MPSTAEKISPATEKEPADVIDLRQKSVERARQRLEKFPELGKVYEKLKKEVAKGVVDSAVRRHRIGLAINEVRSDTEKYGKRSVQILATLLGYEPPTLYAYGAVAATWDEEEFGALLEEKTPLGLSLTFSHLIVLANVSDGRRRRGFMTRAVSEALTVKQLEVLVAGQGETEMVTQERTTTADILRQKVAHWEAAADEIDRDTRELIALAQKKRTQEVTKLLEEAVERQRALAKKATECAEQISAFVHEPA